MKKPTKITPTSFNDLGRVPPQAIDVESSVLGMILNSSTELTFIIGFLKPEHFYKDSHQIIYREITLLYSNDKPIDTIYLVQELRDKNLIDEVGSIVYISSLTTKILSSTNIIKYALVILEKFILREIITHSSSSIRSAFDNEDPFNIITELNSKLTILTNLQAVVERKELKSSISSVIDNMIAVHSDDVLFHSQWFPFNNEVLDQYGLVQENNTLLLAGASGSGKTRFLIYIMRMLLKLHHDKISVKWYSMEDDAAKLIRCFLAPLVRLTDAQMSGVNYRMNEHDHHALLSHKAMFEQFDVDIVEHSKYIDDIAVEFKAFCAKRTDRFCILIIDNAMKLKDYSSKRNNQNQTAIDDYIALQMSEIRTSMNANKVKSWQILVHHLNDDFKKDKYLPFAYRPTEEMIRGSALYRAALTQVLLFNRFGNHPKLLDIYPDMKDIVKVLGTADLIKNRNNKMGMFRFFGDLSYTNFHLIPDYGEEQ